MGQVRTNKTSFNSAVESALGTAGTAWLLVEVNSIGGDLGKIVETVSRDFISVDRQRGEPEIVGEISDFSCEADATIAHLEAYLPAFMFADYQHPGTKGVTSQYAVTAVVDGGASPDEYTVAANGDLAAGELVYARGFPNSENNGLNVLVAGSTGTAIKVATGTLVADAAPPSNAIIEVAGVPGASGDITMTSGGDLASTILDFTTLNLNVGQFIKIGGTATDTFFANETANNDYARITAIAANVLSLDKAGGTFAVDNGASKTIQIFYGRFLRQWDVDNASFLEQTHSFEVKVDNLLPGPADHYLYPVGNMAAQIEIAFPLKGKVTLNMKFMGTTSLTPTTVRLSGASAAVAPTKTKVLTTSGEVWKRLRITEVDETGVLSDLKQGTLRINNNVSREFAQGPDQTQAKYMNYGNHHPDFEGTYLFANKTAVTAIEELRTMTAEYGLKNDDGAIFFDFPAIKLKSGAIGLPVNETITINSPAESFKASTGLHQYSMSVSLFPHVP